jgi:hypothetical protein
VDRKPNTRHYASAGGQIAAEQCKKPVQRRVRVFDNTCNDMMTVYENSGIQEALKNEKRRGKIY